MSTPNIRVEYTTFSKKCEEGANCVLRDTTTTGFEPWLALNGTWIHWRCLKQQTLLKLRISVKGPAGFAGFHDLLSGDRNRIAKDMGWKLDENISEKSLDNPIQLCKPKSSVKMTSKLPQKLTEDIPMSSTASWPKISARDLDAVATDNHTASLGKALQTPKPPFQPVVFFPDTPLPSLDFRPRNLDKNQIPETTTNCASKNIRVSHYRENPLTIVGERFLFVDTEETWDVLEISFGRKGWEGVSIQAGEKLHRIDFEVLISMLEHGVLDPIAGLAWGSDGRN